MISQIGSRVRKKSTYRGRTARTAVNGSNQNQVSTKDLFPIWVFHPYEPIRLTWDMMITLIMLYILVDIPIQLCFEISLRLNHPWARIDLLVDGVFLADIIFNFNTGYIDHESQFVSDRLKIAETYLMGWFWIDLITSLPFEYMVQYRQVSILSKILKAFRVIRLLKIFRVIKVLGSWEESHETSMTTLRMCKFFILIFIIAHTVACFFVGIANYYRTSNDWSFENYYGYNQKSWVVRFAHTWEEPRLVIYLRALYWAFTTLATVGYGDITPLLPLEIIFTIFVQLAGCSLFGYIIGNVSSIITSRDATAVMISDKLDAVKDYIQYRRIPITLANKIQRHYNYAWKRSQAFKEQEILSELPQALRTECSLFIHQDIIKKVPFLSQLGVNVVPSLIWRLKPALAAHGDIIVLEGLFGNEMYFISRGVVAVTVTTHLGNRKKKTAQLKIKELNDGEYFSDYAIVMEQIRHPTSVISESYCDMFVLTRTDFLLFGNQFPLSCRDIVRASRKRYLDLMNSILRTRNHHTFMLGNLDRTASKFHLTAVLLHLRSSLLLRPRAELKETMGVINMQNEKSHRRQLSFESAKGRLSMQMKSAPIVSFKMRMKYHQLLKGEKKHFGADFSTFVKTSKIFRTTSNSISSISRSLRKRFQESTSSRCIPKIKQNNLRVLRKIRYKQKPKTTKRKPLQTSLRKETPKFSPTILEKIMSWKDNARLQVITRTLQASESNFLSKFNENDKAGEVDCLVNQMRSDFQEFKEFVKNELLDLKQIVRSQVPNCVAKMAQEQEGMRTECTHLQKMLLILASDQRNMAGFLGGECSASRHSDFNPFLPPKYPSHGNEQLSRFLDCSEDSTEQQCCNILPSERGR